MESISSVAKKLGIERSKVSKMIKNAGIKTEKKGKEVLVDYDEVQKIVMQQAAEGRLKSPKSTNKKMEGDSNAMLIEALQSQVRNLTKEKEELKEQYEKAVDKIEGLIHLNYEVKLLKAANEKLEAEIQNVKSGNGYINRISKAFDVLKGR